MSSKIFSYSVWCVCLPLHPPWPPTPPNSPPPATGQIWNLDCNHLPWGGMGWGEEACKYNCRGNFYFGAVEDDSNTSVGFCQCIFSHGHIDLWSHRHEMISQVFEAKPRWVSEYFSPSFPLRSLIRACLVWATGMKTRGALKYKK
jgi:hypothetical protein